MSNFLSLFKNYALAGLMILCLLAFVLYSQYENDSEEKVMDNELMNSTFHNLDTSLRTYRDQGQQQKSLFESENPTSGFGTILLFSIVSAGKVFNGLIIGTFNVVIKLPAVFLGIDPIILGVLSSILILTIIIGLWSVYKLGG